MLINIWKMLINYCYYAGYADRALDQRSKAL